MKTSKSEAERLEKKQKHKERRAKYSLIKQIRTNKKAFAVYATLSAITAVLTVRSAINGQWESVFVCFLAFLLYFIPPLVEKAAKVELPTTLEILAFVFVFAAQILGEIENFYIRVPLWDSLLHTVCGFMFAAFGFCLMDILNRGKVNKFDMSPVFLAFLAFCFSMTIGVLWEFVEFGIDSIFLTDMQKDFYVNSIYSVTLDPNAANKVVGIGGIAETVIYQADGTTVVLPGGYLDIGLIDTMKDLLVNFVGAVIFSVIGFFYVKQRGKGKFASQFIPQPSEKTFLPKENASKQEALGEESKEKDETSIV